MNIDLLPKNLKAFADLIGFEKTWLIVERFAGHRLYIPHSIERGDVLIELLGHDDALKIIQNFGCEQIEIATCASLQKHNRDNLIRSDREQMSVPALAKKYSLSRGRIQKICNKK